MRPAAAGRIAQPVKAWQVEATRSIRAEIITRHLIMVTMYNRHGHCRVYADKENTASTAILQFYSVVMVAGAWP